MIAKLAAILLACVVAACSTIPTDAFVYRGTHRELKSPIAGKRTRWDLKKVESGDPTKSDKVEHAESAKFSASNAHESQVRIPRVPSALDPEGRARRVGVVLHLSREGRGKGDAEGDAAGRSQPRANLPPLYAAEGDPVGPDTLPAERVTATGNPDDFPPAAPAFGAEVIASTENSPTLTPAAAASDNDGSQELAAPERDGGKQHGTTQADHGSGMVRDPVSGRGRDAFTGFFFVPRREDQPDTYSLNHQAFDGMSFNRGPSLTLPYFPADVPGVSVRAEAAAGGIEDVEPFPLPSEGRTETAEPGTVADDVPEGRCDVLSVRGPQCTSSGVIDKIHTARDGAVAGDGNTMASPVPSKENDIVDAYLAQAYRDALSGKRPKLTSSGGKDETDAAVRAEAILEGDEDTASLTPSGEDCTIDPVLARAYRDALHGREPQPTTFDDEDDLRTAREEAVPEVCGAWTSRTDPQEDSLVEAYVAQAFREALSGRGPHRTAYGGEDDLLRKATAATLPEGCGYAASLTPSGEDCTIDPLLARAYRDALHGREPQPTTFDDEDDLRTAREEAVPEVCGAWTSRTDPQEDSLVEAYVAQAFRDALSGRGPRRTAYGGEDDLRTVTARALPEGCGNTVSLAAVEKNEQSADTCGQGGKERASSTIPVKTAGKREKLRRWLKNIRDRWTKKRPPQN